VVTGQPVHVLMGWMANCTEKVALKLPLQSLPKPGLSSRLVFAQTLIFITLRLLAILSGLIEFSQVQKLLGGNDRRTDGWTDQQHTHIVSLPWKTKVNRDGFITYSYRHCQPTYVYHHCSLSRISLTDAHIMRKAFLSSMF